MNKYLLIALILTVLGAGGYVSHLQYQNKKMKEEIELKDNNLFAYEQDLLSMNDSISREKGVYLFSIKQLEESNDSLLIQLNKTRKNLKIKDKELKEMTHFAASIKTDTTIVITELVNDSCEFDLKVVYNDQTKFDISNKLVDGQFKLNHKSDISSSFDGFIFTKSKWKEPKFFKRLFLFKWGKTTTMRGTLLPDNDEIKVKDFRVIQIPE